MFLGCPHHTLPASEQLHLAGVGVDVAVRATDGTVHGRQVAGHRAVLPVSGDIVAGP